MTEKNIIMTDKKSPIDVILDEFEKYVKSSIKNKGKSGDSAYQYRQVINAFEVDGAFVPESINKKDVIKANVSKNFLELVPKYINIINDREDEVYDINKVITWINDYKEQYDWEGSGKKSYKSYINSFLKFIKDVCKNKNSYKNIYEVCSEENFSSSDLAILNGKEGDIYLHNKLTTKFKSRLRCQDRTSGDKIWLPLRFIAKIYSKDKKDYDANHKEKKENQFSKWLDKLVDDIYIHYVETEKAGTEKVEKIRFGGETGKSDVHLRLAKHSKKGQTAKEYDVYVRWIDNNDKVIERRVLTPTGRGNEKKKMVVSGIQAIAIDHVKPIDQTLRDLEGKLETLKIVSDYYKELCENDQLKEGNAVNNLLKKDESFIENLTVDLKSIHDDSILRLMDSKLNTQKSNGSTFKKIVKDGTNYYGIIEEDIIADDILDKENSRVVLYQKLDNQMSSNGKLRIIGEISYKGEVKEKDDLVSILNCI